MPVTFAAGSNILATLKHLAAGGDKLAIALIAVMEGTRTALLTPAAQSSRTIRVAGQLQDLDAVLVTGAKAIIARMRMPLLAPGTQVDLATAAALPACTPAGTGVGHTLTGNVNAALTVDGVAVVTGNRILVKDQVAAKDNGVYTVTATGSGAAVFVLTRATDFDAAVTEVVAGANFRIAAGATNAGKVFVHTTIGAIVVDTTALAFFDSNVAGTLALGAAGATVIGGSSTRELVLNTAAAGTFSIDVLSQMAGIHVLEVVYDNGETEIATLTFT